MIGVEKMFDIKQMAKDGLTVSEIARRTGHDRKTVRKLIRQDSVPQYRRRVPAASKLDPFKDYVLQRMEQGVLNSEKVFREIVAQGYTGKQRILREFMSPHRPAMRTLATVRFETRPGEQGQVDWADFGRIELEGELLRLWCFLLVLGYSRAKYIEFVLAHDTETFMQCHINAFRYFGGVPKMLLYDNTKEVVIGRAGDQPIWNRRFADFASYYGFLPQLCKAYRAQTKGEVENVVRYVRESFFAGIRVDSLADLNRQAVIWLETVANFKVHDTTGERPCERLKRENLTPLGDKPDYDTSYLSYRRATRDCLVSYKGNRYSVPHPCAGKEVLVKETPGGELRFYQQGILMATYELGEGKNRIYSQPVHFAGLRNETVRPLPTLRLLVSAPEVQQRSLAEYEAWAARG
ncbi:MAG: IS21 family transposase [Betaproteobacteria bacterium]